MTAIAKGLHALAVSLFFGSVVFFTITGLLVFQAFEDVVKKEDPAWFPVAPPFDAKSVPKGMPVPRDEQGARAAGRVVSEIFPVYFALQAACALVALLTAPAMGGRGRYVLCVLALIVVLVGWGLERTVHHLRVPRNELTDEVLRASGPSEELIEKARQARAAFGMWHGFSLLVNFGALGLSGCLAGLLAFPARDEWPLMR